MMNKRVLSVIVPSYNMESYLPNCLGSLVIADKGLLEKLEVIVVNDGSKDRTSEIAHEFEAKYPGVFKVIDKPNGHYGSCINAALPVVSGIYVKVLDADDYVNTGLFAGFCRIALEETAKGDAGADMLVSSYQNVMDDGEEKGIIDFGLKERTGYYTLDEYPTANPRFTIHAIAYRTSMLLEMEYRQTEGICYTDTEWIIEPMSRVRRFRYCHEAVTYYRLGRDGQSMDPAIFARDFQHVANITIGLVQRYNRFSKRSEQTSCVYYHKQILNMVAVVYQKWREGHQGYPCQVDLELFERQIKNIGDFYAWARNLTVGVNHYRYYYVRDWRRWHCRYTMAWLMYKIVKIVAVPYGALRVKFLKKGGNVT